MNLEVTPKSSWQGQLDLCFGYQNGTTQILSSRAQAPLKLQRPFYPEGNAICHSVILHTAGGIVGGDRLLLNIQLEPHAQALITTPAATKVYRSNQVEAQQSVHIQVAESACLEWLPQEAIIFNQAYYRQDLRVDLVEGASWLGWEITRFGRSARGEQFLAGEWRSHTEVWQGDHPLWIDRQWLPGSAATVQSLHGLADYPVVGTFAWVGQSVPPDFVQQARQAWMGDSAEVGVTRLTKGLVCRYRGHSTTAARKWFTTVWQHIRQDYLNRDRCIPRVW
ncbi:MAG TPA: urease accessory protein UreD [Leptolyngbyaceae cyanobacterium M33_DOE_097]|uniref:Urease accessory protein UreD n=1 Tax=Oscillatoriales cyanobacterium SpSt-418 TaxID=2282169 RepID=A0A7C3KI28_9CYAN|nr:urease accessory protein UreD [Leptolyngbyaceae cyanobacterium M33_DOE_097]